MGARALRCLVSEEGGAGAKAGWGSAGGAELVTVSLATNTQTGCSHSRRPPCMVLEGCRMRALEMLWCGEQGASQRHGAAAGTSASCTPAELQQLCSGGCPAPALPCPALPSCLSSPQTPHLGCRHSCVLAFCPLMNQVSSEFISLLCFAGLVFLVPGERCLGLCCAKC